MKFLKWFYIIGGSITIANGAWMIIAPENWYLYIPAAVHDTGPLNAHFVRDFGTAYLVIGFFLIRASQEIKKSRAIFLGVVFFFGSHAFLHVADILTGNLPHSHWWIDLPLVFAPGIITAIIAWPPLWNRIINREESE